MTFVGIAVAGLIIYTAPKLKEIGEEVKNSISEFKGSATEFKEIIKNNKKIVIQAEKAAKNLNAKLNHIDDTINLMKNAGLALMGLTTLGASAYVNSKVCSDESTVCENITNICITGGGLVASIGLFRMIEAAKSVHYTRDSQLENDIDHKGIPYTSVV